MKEDTSKSSMFRTKWLHVGAFSIVVFFTVVVVSFPHSVEAPQKPLQNTSTDAIAVLPPLKEVTTAKQPDLLELSVQGSGVTIERTDAADLFGVVSRDVLGEKGEDYLLRFDTPAEGRAVYFSSKDTARLFKRIQLAIEQVKGEGDTIASSTLFDHPIFYYNILDKSENVRIVVQVKSGVYAFSYPKEEHARMKEIISKL